MGWITGHDSGLTALDQQIYGDFVGLRVVPLDLFYYLLEIASAEPCSVAATDAS